MTTVSLSISEGPPRLLRYRVVRGVRTWSEGAVSAEFVTLEEFAGFLQGLTGVEPPPEQVAVVRRALEGA